MNNTVEFLDEIKIGLRKTFENFYDNKNSIHQFYFNEFVSDDDFRQSIMIIRRLAKEKDIKLQDSYNKSRTVEEFILGIYWENEESYVMCLKDISSVYNEFSNYLEDNLYEVEIVKIASNIPHDLTYQSIVRDLNNCDKRIAEKDYAGAITSAKTVVEGVCKELLIILGENVTDENHSLPKLFNVLSKHLNLDSSNVKFEKSLKEITSGLSKVIHGLAEVRNQSSDSHSKTVNPQFHHAVLAVNSAKTVASFLFHTYEFQKTKGSLGIIINK